MSPARSLCNKIGATIRNSGLALVEQPFFGLDQQTDNEALQNWEKRWLRFHSLERGLVEPAKTVIEMRVDPHTEANVDKVRRANQVLVKSVAKNNTILCIINSSTR